MKDHAYLIALASAAFSLFSCNLVFAAEPAQTEYENQLMTEASALPERPLRDGFDEGNKGVIKIGGCMAEIPDYFAASEEDTKLDGSDEEYYCAYAETDGKVAMLQVEARRDSLGDVDFSVIREQSDEVASAFGESFDSYSYDEPVELTIFDDEKGLLWTFSFEIQEKQGDGRFLIFPSRDENCWVQFLLMQTDNTIYDYSEDFMKILSSIRKGEESAANYRATTIINIRSAPDETDDGNKLGKIPEGAVLSVDPSEAEEEKWIKVFYTDQDGNTINGWVSKDYVELIESDAAEPEPETEAAM